MAPTPLRCWSLVIRGGDLAARGRTDVTTVYPTCDRPSQAPGRSQICTKYPQSNFKFAEVDELNSPITPHSAAHGEHAFLFSVYDSRRLTVCKVAFL